MHVLAPVSSVSAAETFARMGIDEVYVGVESPEHFEMKNVTFTGRSKRLPTGGYTQLKNFEELGQVVSICHAHGMKVNFTANVRNLSEELNGYYLEYVESAIQQGVDTLIVGAISALILLNQQQYGLPLHASTFFYPFNKYNVDFFHGLNVKRIILPTALRFQEIGEMKDYIRRQGYNMEIEVFSHFGCSNINGRCNIFHDPPSVCRGKFAVYDHEAALVAENYSFLDGGSDCSICSLKKLYECGVDTLKILGRGLPISLVGSLAMMYRQAVDQVKQGIEVSSVREAVLKKAPWWNESFCKDDRCFYIPTERSRYYV